MLSANNMKILFITLLLWVVNFGISAQNKVLFNFESGRLNGWDMFLANKKSSL